MQNQVMPQHTGQAQRLPAPPYVSFLTFLHLVIWLETEGIPLRYDKSFWESKFSGSKGAQLLASLRFLNLINGAQTKPDLARLVAARGDDRKRVLSQLLQNSYSTVEFDKLSRATPAMLDEWFSGYSIDGDTRRKAVSFLINALKYVEHPLSPSLSRKARNKPQAANPGGKATNGEPAHASRNSDPRDVQPVGNERTIRLISGGEVTVTINVDLFGLSDDDREFVMALIGQVREYDTGRQQDE